MEGVSKFESVTQPGASWKAAFGAVWELPATVTQLLPNPQVPEGVQSAGPEVKEVVQPVGNAGGVTASKPSQSTLK